MKASRPLLPPVERVSFRKTEPPKQIPMTTREKVAGLMRKHENGEVSAADVAKHHRAWALEAFPLAKNADAALGQWYGTLIGKVAMQHAVACEHLEKQLASRIGDGDIAIKGECEISHDHPAKPKKSTRTPTDGGDYTSAGDNDRPNRQLNTTPVAMAKYCDSFAAEYSARHGVTKAVAYGELLKNDPAFKIVWKAALTLPAE
jgi:hypothetical protein